MNQISVLSQETIDKIAAGEVVERPASIVKELVENAIDAGANAVTVEIKDGGISLIRITDNGSGIPQDQVQVAFLRHATSKIRTVEDLLTAGTLGFRGEALSSIAAVCQVEMITKTAGSITGVRYVIEGGVEKSLEEIGAPEGTTFLVRNLFYNTPARKKFLKTATTEAGYVSDLMERIAVSHPGISFKFINNNDSRMHTSGNCNLKDIIYGIYGREIAANVVKVDGGNQAIHITGFIGKPVISRGNRNYENYFVNGRYVKSAIVARAIEDAYKPFMMSHRYPFTALMIQVDTEQVDVNVHPTKMEVRFADQPGVYDQVFQIVKETLAGRELIPEFTIDNKKNTFQTSAPDSPAPDEGFKSKSKPETPKRKPFTYPEPFEKIRSQLIAEANSPYEVKYPRNQASIRPVTGNIVDGRAAEFRSDEAALIKPETEFKNDEAFLKKPEAELKNNEAFLKKTEAEFKNDEAILKKTEAEFKNDEAFLKKTEAEFKNDDAVLKKPETDPGQAAAFEENRIGVNPPGNTGQTAQEIQKPEVLPQVNETVRETLEAEIQSRQAQQAGIPVQMEIFEDKLLDEGNRKRHKIIGQIFNTYWIVEFDDKMYIIDQHAAHEKVMYERFMEKLRLKQQTSQMITPPIIVTLSLQEEEILKKNMEHFTAIGFEISHFGGHDYSISGVPGNLYSIAERTLFTEILDGLTDVSEKASSDAIQERLASMSCKAAVKGNNRLSVQEADALIGELLELENPYNCPHGRPTIITMSKYELEKKFKRVI